MTFNPNTYNIAQRSKIVEAWSKIKLELDHNDLPEVWTGGKLTKNQALAQVFAFNRVRSAMRAQWEDGHSLDYIKVEAVKRPPPDDTWWHLRFSPVMDVDIEITTDPHA